MSQMSSATDSVPRSAGAGGGCSPSEKSATAPAPVKPASAPKLRSCVTCRTRKVRCDKQSPCSHCRRANIACVLPSTDRPPRWARRLDHSSNTASSSSKAMQEAGSGVGQVMERLRTLESLVKELSGQLEQANATAARSTGSSSHGNSPGSSNNDHHVDPQMDTLSSSSSKDVQKQFGRMVLKDANQSRYVSSGFWSRVNDEIDGLKMDTRDLAGIESGTSEEEDSPGKTPSTQELERTPFERHAFLFKHNLGPSNPDLREFQPLPSQIPFLINVYSDNVNLLTQIVHIPTVTKMIRELRGRDTKNLTPANQALMFSIYYAAVTSMEEDDILTNFNCTKAHLTLKYQLGLEHALAKADFLNLPSIILVQAFTIFLFLVRRHDSPRFAWMMTGLVIRMAQALGLQRDGSHFNHLTPYEVEIRRRVWWALCILDVRASEDQGMDLTITNASFDTKLPLNINDAEIDPQTKETPPERHSMTDMTFALASNNICEVVRRLTATISNGSIGPRDQSSLLNELYESVDRVYLQYSTEDGNILHWVAVTTCRLVMAKMTLIVYLPFLFTASGDLSDEIRTKLLVSAIEVAEDNHSLNSETACRQWRWMFQTYTHWHAIVYLLLEISRRRWSPIVERGWMALHSNWLIPVQSKTNKNQRKWIPFRQLMSKARIHRDAELQRLRADPRAAVQLEMEDSKIPLPMSSGPFPSGKSDEIFREIWRKLVAMPEGALRGPQPQETPATPSIVLPAANATQQSLGPEPVYGDWSNSNFEPYNLTGQELHPVYTTPNSATATSSHSEVPLAQTEDLSYNSTVDALPSDWVATWSTTSGIMPWLFPDISADTDINMDLAVDVNWYEWVESAKGMEWDSAVTGDNIG